MSSKDKDIEEYVLGTHEDEACRLGLQHALWAEYAHAIWKRAGISFGSRVLDAGSGPGFATLDLARIVGSTGHVAALEYSPVFVDSLKQTLATGGVPGVDMGSISVQQGDLQNVALEPNSQDAAYLRWVLCFLEDVQAAIRNVAVALRPGGKIVIQDYINFMGALTLHPPSIAFQKLATAFHDSWIGRGGNSRVGLELPTILAECGFEIEDVRTVSFTLRPQDSLWRWPESFFPIVAKSLVEQGVLTQADQEEFLQDWRKRSSAPNSVFCTPCVVEIIAKKK